MLKLDVIGDLVWAKVMPGTGANGSTGWGLVLDDSGGVYTAGTFNYTVDFDPGAGIANLTSGGDGDIFVQKLDVDGTFVWAKALVGSSFNRALDIALDASGNVYTTGHFSGMADFDPSADFSGLTSVGGSDIFVSKLIPLDLIPPRWTRLHLQRQAPRMPSR